MKLIIFFIDRRNRESPPARGRGLKRIIYFLAIIPAKSPPARGRGLKRSEADNKAGLPRRPPRGGVD